MNKLERNRPSFSRTLNGLRGKSGRVSRRSRSRSAPRRSSAAWSDLLGRRWGRTGKASTGPCSTRTWGLLEGPRAGQPHRGDRRRRRHPDGAVPRGRHPLAGGVVGGPRGVGGSDGTVQPVLCGSPSRASGSTGSTEPRLRHPAATAGRAIAGDQSIEVTDERDRPTAGRCQKTIVDRFCISRSPCCRSSRGRCVPTSCYRGEARARASDERLHVLEAMRGKEAAPSRRPWRATSSPSPSSPRRAPATRWRRSRPQSPSSSGRSTAAPSRSR